MKKRVQPSKTTEVGAIEEGATELTEEEAAKVTGGAETSQPSVSEIVITKVTDQASPSLFGHALGP